MRVGQYTLTEFLGSSQLFTAHRAHDQQTNTTLEIRLLNFETPAVRPRLEAQLRRMSWVQSSLVRQPVSFDLDGEHPYVALVETEPHTRRITASDAEQFIVQGTTAIDAAHGMGLSIGPFMWPLFSLDAGGNCQLDASGLLTHLTVGDGESFARFEFAAPESLELGCCDRLSDVYSWGRFLLSILEPQAADLPDRVRAALPVIAQLAHADPAERASLNELLTLFADVQPGTAATSAMEFAGDGDEYSLQTVARTFATDIEVEPRHPVALQTQLGRFVLEAELGAGGMGAVYKARDLASSQWFALKVLSSKLSSNPRAVKRFAKEARLLALARSPYVANLIEASTEGEPCYLVSEFVEGGSLADWLRPDQALPVSLSLAILVDIVRGLALAHDRGIVHRDIKPENILLTSAGRSALDTWRGQPSDTVQPPAANQVVAKLADFGIARTEFQSESLAMTAENSLLGTPLYMAPEQCMGSRVDPRADIYSLGVTLYKLLAGRTPFMADSNLLLMSMHANETPPPLRQFVADVPEAVTQVVDKCLAKNPDARYSHARELLIDLENILRGQPTGIGLHPPLINQQGADVLTFEHSWDLQSTPAQLWPYVAHTDRVNHAMGLTAVEYTTQSDPVMGVVRMAETTVAGTRLRWREHPYEWIEGKRLSVLREFTQGPFEWFVNVVELLDRATGGCTVRQTLKVKPRNWLGKTLAKLQLGGKSRKSFGKVYTDIDRFVQSAAAAPTGSANQQAQDPWGSRFQMTAAQRSRLKSRMATLGMAPAALMLADLIEHGSELEVARLRPYALADRCQLNRNEVMETCLRAAREGLLVLLWDILCPSCRIPSDVVETLAALKGHSHCQACNIEFELDFSRSIEMIFRVHPELRAAETRTYCIGGPAWSRHVVAQVRLAQGERFVCDVELEDGSYAVRGPQLPFSVPFRVGPMGTESRWEVAMGRAPDSSDPTVLRSGRQAIWLWNDSSRDLEVRIERMASRHDAVTAAAATSSALFRELFGDQVLAGGQLISVAHISYLLVKLIGTGDLYRTLGDAQAFTQIRQQLSTIEAAVKKEDGAVIKTIGETVVATFPKQLAAFRCADQLCQAAAGGQLQIGAVVHSGPAVVATLDERLDYFGKLVHESLSLLELCTPGQIVTMTDAITSPEVQAWLVDSHNLPRALEHQELAVIAIGRTS